MPSVVKGKSPVTAEIRFAALMGAVYFAIGCGAILLTRQGFSVAIIWPGDAVVLCVLLRKYRHFSQTLPVLAAVFFGGILANAIGGSTPLLTVAFSLINVVEIGAGYALTRRVTPLRFLTVKAGLKFGVLSGLVTPAIGGSLAGLVTFIGARPDAWISARDWYFADALGFFVVAPFAMTLSRRELQKLNLSEHAGAMVLTILGLLIVALGAFSPIAVFPLFLVIPACIFATYAFRLLGASVATILMSVVGIPLVQFGMSRPMIFGSSDPVAQIQLFQLLLAVCSLTCVAVAALLNERDMHMAIFDRRRQRALAASAFKTRLLSQVSHEVRKPLSAIIGFGSMLESGTLTPDKAPEFAKMITRNGELLRRLHDDLLDLARAEAGRLEIAPERMAIGQALSSFVQYAAPSIMAGNAGPLVIEKVEDALAVSADPMRFLQIMNNLIDNARKYGSEGAPIVITAKKLDDHFGRIEVRNYGPGIKPEYRAQVFKPFARIEGANAAEGSGLGLSITKMLVELQGGHIDFESVPGRQTRFWIDLPLAA